MLVFSASNEMESIEGFPLGVGFLRVEGIRIKHPIHLSSKLLSDKALSTISAYYLQSAENQIKLVELLSDSLPETRHEIIYRLQLPDDISPETVLRLLDKYDAQRLSGGELNQILRIVSKQVQKDGGILKSGAIKEKLTGLMNSSDSSTSKVIDSFFKSIRFLIVNIMQVFKLIIN